MAREQAEDGTKHRGSRMCWDSGLAWRLGLTAVLVSGGVIATVRPASGAFEAATLPIANMTGQNALVEGTARLMGDHFLLYNGTRIESMNDSMAVNFERGGSMLMCPRSELQLLTAKGGPGILLAIETGGAQSPFPLRMGDEIMTPDWRVELTSDSRTGEMGLIQVVTNRHGDLCMQAESQSGAYYRVTPMLGDGEFRVVGGQSARFSGGRMETSTEACGCDAGLQAKADPPVIGKDPAAAVNDAGAPPTTAPSPARAEVSPEGSQSASVSENPAAPAAVPGKKHRKHPEDLAGYVSGFMHKLFGR